MREETYASTVRGDDHSDFVWDRCLHQLFEQKAREVPYALAVVAEYADGTAQQVSYRELNRRANRVAHALRAAGLRPGETVGVHLTRGIPLYAALLGTWKAGGAYVPLDSAHPPEQVQRILSDSAARIVLTECSLAARCVSEGVRSLCIETLLEDGAGPTELDLDLDLELHPERFALLLYTSGSTGRPKGVKHRETQLLNRFQWLWREYPFADTDVMCQRTPLNFQPSLWELLGGLLRGVTTVVLADAVVRDPSRFARRIQQYSITHATIVPSLLRMMLRESSHMKGRLESLKWIVAAGEPLSAALVADLMRVAPQVGVLCDYGSTETNGVLFFDTRGPQQEELPGFHPIANVRPYILDEHQRPVPEGASGELCFAGRCLADGYWNDEALTAERFFEMPGEPPERVFRTGDFAHLGADGAIRLEGRRDDQVKIRGNRVSLAGVESELSALPGVAECRVLAEHEKGRSLLFAYVVAHPGATLTASALREQLLARVPSYMVPAHIKLLQALPLLPNGKVDRQGLLGATGSVVGAPAGDLLGRVTAVAAEVLRADARDLHPDHKFYALGFDSESIAQLAMKLQAMGLSVTVSDLYSRPSLREISLALSEQPAPDAHALGAPTFEPAEPSYVQAKVVERAEPHQAYAIGAEPPELGNVDGRGAETCVDPFAPSAPASKSHAPLRPTATANVQTSSALTRLRDAAARVLGVTPDELAPSKKLYELGFDSESLAEWVQTLNASGFPDLTVRDAYDHPTLAGLAALAGDSASQMSDLGSTQPTDIAQAGVERPTPKAEPRPGAVAIIAASGRFPGANNLDELWQVLRSGRDTVRALPTDRWSGTDRAEPGIYGGFLDGIDQFDPAFFDISPREAVKMDPQQRLVLEECWNVLEAAGLSKAAVHGKRVGVFLGARPGDYADVAGERGPDVSGFGLLGSDQAILAARVAYWLNLQGPTLTVDTACSSSLVALHLACQSVRSGECEMAIAGGVHIMCTSHLYRASAALGMLSPTGRCMPFDARANGMVPSEAVSMVLVKSLEAAERDGDSILAVVLASGVNQDGQTNGITAPSALAQQRLIEQVYRDGKINPRTISYVEAHGTGTKQGDPIEVSALAATFRKWTDDKGFCTIGSAKANVGHAVAAAGMVGLAKLLLAFRHRALPGTPHFASPNPELRLATTPFVVSELTTPWVSAGPRRAAISSFGFSGTNAHVVLEEGPQGVSSATGTSRGSVSGMAVPSRAFKRSRYWPEPAAVAAASATSVPTVAVPSRLDLTFDPNDPLLRDHRVADRCVMAGAMMLEVVRDAVAGAVRREVHAMSDIVWLRPVPVSTDAPVRLCLHIDRGEAELRFSLRSGDDAQPTVHCEGVCELSRSENWSERLEESQGAAGAVQGSAEYYAQLRSQGLGYGPAYRAIQSMTPGATRALAQIALPATAGQGLQKGILHPALLDGILQSATGLGQPGRNTAHMPFAVRRVAWRGRLAAQGVAVASAGPAESVDLRYFDTAGELVLRIEGLVCRPVPHHASGAALTLHAWGFQPARGVTRAVPRSVWVVASDDGAFPFAEAVRAELTKAGASARVLEGASSELTNVLTGAAQEGGWPEALVVVPGAPGGELVLETYDRLGALVLDVSREVARAQPARTRTVIVACRGDESLASLPSLALGGFARAVNRESRWLDVRVVHLAADESSPLQARRLAEECAQVAEPGAETRYRSGRRETRALERVDNSKPRQALRRGGAYLVTGGLGGVGYALALHLAGSYGAKLALLGRSPLTSAGRDRLRGLAEAGGEAIYIPCNVSDAQATQHAIDRVLQLFGKVDGVFHCAGELRDCALANKTRADLASVAASKVRGALHLDQALASTNLDFFVLFSSLAGVTGNAGQCDYAYANCFLDAFASHRARLVSEGKRYGQSLSIAWPLWQSDGMQMHADVLARWRSEFGLEPMPVQVGLSALERALETGLNEVVVFHGNAERFEALLRTPTIEEVATLTPPARDEGALAGHLLRARLVVLAAETAELEVSRVRVDQELRSYGFESLLLNELTRRVNAELGVRIPPSTFFDYPTLAQISDYLCESYPGEVRAALGSAVTVEPETVSLRETPEPRRGSGEPTREPVAIIGVAGRLPGAGDDLARFFERLMHKESAFGPMPSGRCELAPDATETPTGAFLERVDTFDAGFFSISPHEARLMDPQQRLLLETAWNAIENAGYRASSLRKRAVGVFVGAFSHDYAQWLEAHAPAADAHLLAASDHGMLANRLSYVLDLCGPSEAIDTACSSSLVALHRAVAALRAGECELALVAGVHLLLSPRGFATARSAGILSARGRGRPFDAEADGYVRGEGLGVVILKPLSQALADGDCVHAVVRGSAVTHGGRAYALTAPSASAQTRVMVEAIDNAGLRGVGLDHIEAHGTGSPMSDGIELRALSNALSQTGQARPCTVSSLKGNIGHLEGASGLASVLKATLSLRHSMLPATAGFSRLHPDHEGLAQGLTVLAEPRVLSRSAPVRIGIHSFGLGGTNAHVVLESSPAVARTQTSAGPQLFVFSAKTRASLEQAALRVAEEVQRDGAPSLADVAHTLRVGREPFEIRAAVLAETPAELLSGCKRLLDGSFAPGSVWASWLPEGDLPIDPEAAMERGDLSELAMLFCRGADLDWKGLWTPVPVRRVPLPGYAFDPVPHWLVPEHAPNGKAPSNESVVSLSVAGLLSSVLGFALDARQAHVALRDVGFDSIMAIKVKHLLETQLGCALATERVARCETLRDLEALVAEERTVNGARTAAVDTDLGSLEARLRRGELRVDALSEEVVEALFARLQS